jgi:hypothetical protein
MRRIRWKRCKDEAQVYDALLRELPFGTPAAVVRTFLTAQGLGFWDDENLVRTKIRMRRRSLFVIGEWLTEFHFLDDRLDAVAIRPVFTGP